MKKFKFILNDENQKNQYGFRVRNSGLKLERFKANPVLLDFHQSGNSAVIGRWENLQIEGSQMTAEALFDDGDPVAMEIYGKVERGFLRGASLGLDPFSMDNFQVAPDGTYDLLTAEVIEASIVPVPNNANALVKLYATAEDSMKELKEKEVQEILLMANDLSNFKLNNMNKIKLAATAALALGLNADSGEHEISAVESKILQLKADLDKANQTIDGFKELEADKKNKLAATTVDADIKAGKIADASKREDFIKLALEQPDLYKVVVTNAAPRVKLSAQVSHNIGDVKTLDDFQKLDLNAQLEFKNENPDLYKALFS